MFTKLLQKIDLQPQADEARYLENGSIAHVEVHQVSKRWDFTFTLSDILPFQLFVQLQQHLNSAFQGIAQTTLTINTTDPEVTNRNLGDYWQWVVANSGLRSNLTQSLCEGKVPYLQDGRVMLLADNEIIKNFLVTQALGPLEDTYRKVGFPSQNITTLVDESASQDKIAEYKEKKAKNDAELAQKAIQAIQKQNQQKEARKSKKELPQVDGPVQLGKKISSDIEPRQMNEITEEERSVVIQGYVFDKEVRVLRSERQLLILKITDYSSSFVVKKFSRDENDEAMFAALEEGSWVKVRGSVQEDSYMHELVVNAYDLNSVSHPKRKDTAPADKKRVELHLHSNMSMMDATNSISDYVKQAADWGQKAIAITDHGTLQAFPEAHSAGEQNGVKILYGVEANVVDDGTPIAYNSRHIALKDATYVVFDTETTGLSARYDKVIELAAVKMKDGNVVDTFEQFIDPGHPLSQTTINLTSITDDMVRGSKSEEEVFKMFQDFCQDTIIVGHNATFDVDFMNTGYVRHGLPEISEPWIDTLPFARVLYPEMKRFQLNNLAKKLNVNLEHHHRAIYDAEATGFIYFAMMKDAAEKFAVKYHDQLNEHAGENESYKHEHPFHVTILAQTQAGLKNLFKAVSAGMTEYFYRVPRIPRSVLEKYREGLLVGSACSDGEVFTAMMQKGYDTAKEKARFYDYLEIQPKPLYAPLLEQELVKDNENLEEIIKNMVQLAHELELPIAATGDVHYMNKEDAIYRKILIHSQSGANPLNRLRQLPDAHFRTTDEMLEEFSFLGEDTAQEVVVGAPAKIAEMCDEITPVKDKLYTPKMPGAEDDIKNLTMDQAHALYGDQLPEVV